MIACRTSSYAPFQHLAFEHLLSLGLRWVEMPVSAASERPETLAELDGYGLGVSALQV